jgi:hypothetical protein
MLSWGTLGQGEAERGPSVRDRTEGDLEEAALRILRTRAIDR